MGYAGLVSVDARGLGTGDGAVEEITVYRSHDSIDVNL